MWNKFDHERLEILRVELYTKTLAALHYPGKNAMLTPRQRLPWLQNSYGTRIAKDV